MSDYSHYPIQNVGERVGFERVRRITGYLVGTMEKWNDAKAAEEKDRVKHSLEKPYQAPHEY